MIDIGESSICCGGDRLDRFYCVLPDGNYNRLDNIPTETFLFGKSIPKIVQHLCRYMLYIYYLYRFCLVVCLLLFYAIASVFQLYYGGDMMYEM